MSMVRNKVIDDGSSPGADTCVVCFKNFEIYSIGECDHPVCYECSTRMRVLCQQNECPICRQSLSKVIFTNERTSYRDLETKGRTECYNKKYKIAFANIIIQKAFYSLLDHRCSMCNCRPFHSFEALKEHVRKEHEHFYCDICTDNLKIFSFERKCYNRQDLGMHRRKGDADNKSHRGHPLCQYCDCRFLDRDDLFRHLRREHYFCHFCDADGSNQFYADYDSLRTHFRNDHFLCEEGDCAREQFTAVFRSDIDLKAHIANTHGKTLGKLQAKQARTLQLQITLGPRNRANQQENEQSNHNSRSRLENTDHRYENGYNISKVNQQRHQPTIDAQNEQEFPSLDGGTSSKSTVTTLAHPSLSLLHKSFGSGLARTKENFPALGGKAEGSDDSVPKSTNNKNINQLPTSAVVKKHQMLQQKPQDSMVIHVTRRPNSLANESISNNKDFPALPRKLKKHSSLLEEDLIPPTSNISNMNVVAAKHRLLVNDYVSEGNINANQKLQLIQSTTTNDNKNKSVQEKTYSLAKGDFPALAPVAPSTSQTKHKNIVGLENRKLKNGNMPLGKYDKFFEKNSVLLKKCKTNSNIDINNKKPNKKPNSKLNTKKTTEPKTDNNQNKGNDNNNECSAINNNDTKQNLENENFENIFINKIVESPRPDLSKSKILKPPPGFQAVTLNSLAKSNDLTFTTSLGEMFKVLPSPNLYLPPSDSIKRNQDLILHFRNILPSSEDFEEFRCISKKFRDGTYETVAYVEYCRSVLKDNFHQIFPELLALLPDISKQQDLYLIFSQHIKKKANQKTEHKLEICSDCKQILKHDDVAAHKKSHDMNLNFPSLSK